MNLLTDIEALIAAVQKALSSNSMTDWFAVATAGWKVVSDIMSVLTPQQAVTAHEKAKGLASQSVPQLLSGLCSATDQAKSGSSIPWGTILAYVLAILAKIIPLPVVTSGHQVASA